MYLYLVESGILPLIVGSEPGFAAAGGSVKPRSLGYAWPNKNRIESLLLQPSGYQVSRPDLSYSSFVVEKPIKSTGYCGRGTVDVGTKLSNSASL